jgi:hypothetical protein
MGFMMMKVVISLVTKAWQCDLCSVIALIMLLGLHRMGVYGGRSDSNAFSNLDTEERYQ